MLIAKKSMVSGKIQEMDIPLTEEQYHAGLAKMEDGALIQDAFPTLNDDQREFLLTGITPQEWDETFPEEDEENDFDIDQHFGLDDHLSF